MLRTRLATALLGLASLAAALTVTTADAAPVAPAPTVIGSEVIGRSVQGRAIRAYHLGDPTSPRKAVVLGSIHGDETAGIRVTEGIRRGSPVHELDLWVIPTVNPDGVARGTRQNAHGVDLNRNFPYHWVDLDGNYESGRRAASEPETRAMMRFLRDIKPAYILSFHQPLNAVDIHVERPKFARKVANKLNLPTSNLDCGGVCHGTMTGWYNHRYRGFALTVEYGPHPSRKRMRTTAPRQVLSIFGASRGTAAAATP